jgi:hypothetical protein
MSQQGKIQITKGFLDGYTTHMKIAERRAILKKVVNREIRKKKSKHDAAMEVMRALIARSNLNKNNSPLASERMKRDANWVRKEYNL